MNILFPWQQKIWQQLLTNKQKNCLPHAWLLTGSPGIGKTELAHYLAAWLFCDQNKDAPCGTCKACILWESQQHPDFYLLKKDDKDAYSTHNIRTLRNQLLQTAQQGSVKVVLMETANQLTISAANALLKIIEEPPAEIYFILVTDRAAALPITLRSRCQWIHCPVPEQAETIEWLSTQTQHSTQEITKILPIAYGAPLLTLKLLNDPQLFADYQKNANDFLAVVSGKLSPLTVAASWKALDVVRLMEIIQYCLRRIVRQAMGIGAQRQSVLANVPVEHWFKLYDELLLGYRRLLLTPGLNRQLFWEHFLLLGEGSSCS